MNVRIQKITNNEVTEVTFEEAEKIIANAIEDGQAVIDKQTGMVIDKLLPGMEVVMIVDLQDGG